jgi:hypothetical protein
LFNPAPRFVTAEKICGKKKGKGANLPFLAVSVCPEVISTFAFFRPARKNISG